MQEYNETGLKSFKTPRTREGKQAGKGGQPAEKQKWKEGGGRCKWRGRLCETERHTERERGERGEGGMEVRWGAEDHILEPAHASRRANTESGWMEAKHGREWEGEEG